MTPIFTVLGSFTLSLRGRSWKPWRDFVADSRHSAIRTALRPLPPRQQLVRAPFVQGMPTGGLITRSANSVALARYSLPQLDG